MRVNAATTMSTMPDYATYYLKGLESYHNYCFDLIAYNSLNGNRCGSLTFVNQANSNSNQLEPHLWFLVLFNSAKSAIIQINGVVWCCVRCEDTNKSCDCDSSTLIDYSIVKFQISNQCFKEQLSQFKKTSTSVKRATQPSEAHFTLCVVEADPPGVQLRDQSSPRSRHTDSGAPSVLRRS